MATMLEVARAAGVSRSTVSNVFNTPEQVRPAVRERVEAAARELGYDGPNPKGRLLRAGKVNAIGVVPPGAYSVAAVMGSPFFQAFVTGVAEVCDEEGASLTIISGLGDDGGGGVRNAVVDGFILGRSEDLAHIEPAMRRRLPFVVMDMDAGPDVNSVRIEGRAGARQAAAHLVALGHRRFAILAVQREGPGPIFYPPTASASRAFTGAPLDHEKLAGYAEALAAAGVAIDDVPIVQSYPAAPEGPAMLLDVAPEATAALVMSDRQAVLLLAEARRRGIDVPGDLSVVGFDDAPDASFTRPPLTTVAQPLIEKGRIAARIVFEAGPPRHVVLPVELVVRGSTAPPPVR